MLIDTEYQRELNKILKEALSYDIVSFDIFDTLVLRNVLFPKDIFKILSEFAEREFGIRGFYSIRTKSETEARETSVDEDIGVDEIYKQIEKSGSANKNACKMILAEELRLEKLFIVENPFMKNIFNELKNSGKRIFILSDMYLPTAFLQELLQELGYDGYEKIYISGDLKKTKYTGSMFRFVLNEIGKREANRWGHIGDNRLSDVEIPNSLGIHGIYYPAVRERAHLDEIEDTASIPVSIMKAMQYNKLFCNDISDYWQRFGIEYLAPIYYGMADWLAICNQNNDNLVFLSRDGYIVKKAFDLIKEKRMLSAVHSQYLYTSRKAYVLPCIVLREQDDVIRELTSWNSDWGHKMSVEEMLHNVGLDADEYYAEILSEGFSGKQETITYASKPKAERLLAKLYKNIFDIMEKKLQLVEAYLLQEGIHEHESVNIVDIGWRGSIQYAIENIMKKYNVNTMGYYLGTNAFAIPGIKMSGYYFCKMEPRKNAEACLDNIMMFELVFSSPTPQLIGFNKSGEKIEPVFRDFIENQNFLISFQNSAIEMVEAFMKYDDYLTGIPSVECMKPYVDFIARRSYSDMLRFYELYNYVSYDTGKRPYVTKVTREAVLQGMKPLWKEIALNLWTYAYIVEGIETEQEAKTFFIKEKKRRLPAHVEKRDSELRKALYFLFNDRQHFLQYTKSRLKRFPKFYAGMKMVYHSIKTQK